MSTEQTVNQTPPGSFLEAELRKLEKPEVQELQAAEPMVKETLTKPDWVEKWSMSPAAVEAGHVESTEGVPSDEFPEDPADTIGNTTSSIDLLGTMIISRAEFDKFKAQVIMALKHNGIDVRKFFGV